MISMFHGRGPVFRAAFRYGAARAALLALLLTAASFSPGRAQCVSGTITAAMQTEGPWQGFYKYTVAITWDSPQGLSNFTLDSNFGYCPEAACAQTWMFDAVAGTGEAPGGCQFGFTGEFNCGGNPSIDLVTPVLKWDALPGDDCEAAASGTAVLVFYTDVSPNPGEIPIGLVKNGQNVCQGEIRGDSPMPCPVPVEPTTWGRIKRLQTRHS